MQFYDATNKRAISQEIDRLCDSDDTAYPRLDKTARVNDGLEEMVAEAISSDGVWEWDDTNRTDLPIGTGTLVEGQESYSFSAEYLKVVEIDILTTTAGLWRRLKQISRDDLDGLSKEEYFGVTSGNPAKGMPEFYDIEGDSIRLFPAPAATSVTLASGLRIQFKRTASLFTPVSTTVADTTEPGFASPFHVLLAYYAAIPYCMAFKKDRVALYEKRWDMGMKKFIKFYGKRNPDRRDVMTPKKELYI